jgi:hypothetical protein
LEYQLYILLLVVISMGAALMEHPKKAMCSGASGERPMVVTPWHGFICCREVKLENFTVLVYKMNLSRLSGAEEIL